MSDNRFVFATTLEGYINALVPSGKFNNCTIGFRIPDELIPKFDEQYENALEWGKNKLAGKRSTAELPKWDESGFVKLSYGGDSNNPMFPWVDTDGQPIPLTTQIWKGTKVRMSSPPRLASRSKSRVPRSSPYPQGMGMTLVTSAMMMWLLSLVPLMGSR
jgi:hypothetical protein